MRILALDTATATGFCYGDSAAVPTYGTQKFKVGPKSLGPLALQMHLWLDDLIKQARPQLVIFEAPLLSFGRGRVRTSVAGARLMMGLTWHVEFLAHSYDVRCVEVDNQVLKQFWCQGSGGDKAPMIRMAQLYGYDPQDDNAADAIAIWSYGVQLFDPRNAVTKMGPLGKAAGL